MCVRGYSEMQFVLKNVTDDRIRGYFVWLPIISGDDRAFAVERSTEFTDDRITHYWDGEQLTAKAWDSVLETQDIAWDVYLIYGPTSSWEKEPPAPVFWMHGLMGIVHAPQLDRAVFETKLRELLKSAK